ncbi:hypothetical protein DFS34DRAFT_251782 [Phlyctochytrium arcticum]|nr:hypothetical protein DFS34DRAFT_251782 [Phlyctochytrium arcticum]
MEEPEEPEEAVEKMEEPEEPEEAVEEMEEPEEPETAVAEPEASVTEEAGPASTTNEEHYTFDSKQRNLFRKKFQKFEDGKKWLLQSGRAVEDVLYEGGLQFKHVNIIHSFTYVSTDRNVTDLFTEAERKEIERDGVKCPDPFTAGGSFHRMFNRFAQCKTAAELRNALYSGCPELLEDNARVDDDFWLCQIYHVFLTDILLQGRNTGAFHKDLSEAWLLANPYHVLQPLFGDQVDMFFLTGEKSGIAVAQRKNKDRAVAGSCDMARKAVGKKGDGYVRSFVGIGKDLAATEAAAKWQVEAASKTLVEAGAKLPKVLRDIFVSNLNGAKNREHVLRGMAVPGLAVAGPMVSLLLCDSPHGYVVRCTVSPWLETQLGISKASMTGNAKVF